MTVVQLATVLVIFAVANFALIVAYVKLENNARRRIEEAYEQLNELRRVRSTGKITYKISSKNGHIELDWYLLLEDNNQSLIHKSVMTNDTAMQFVSEIVSKLKM